MKACVFTEYGPPDVLRLKEVQKPIIKENEILIRVKAVPVNSADTLIRNFRAVTPKKFHMPFLFWVIGKIAFGISKPKVTILGSEFSGVIDEVGRAVKNYKKGDEVFGYCGPRMGAYAEFLRVPKKGVFTFKPTTLTHEEASTLPYGSIMAFNILKRIDVRPGQKILVNGASGGIGPQIVQIAHNHFGANVTGVCGTKRIEYVKSIGADSVIDYTKEDFTQNNVEYAFIIDILGKLSLSRCKKSLSENGKMLFISFKSLKVFQMLWTMLFCKRKAICVIVNEKVEDLISIKEFVEAGIIKAVIDRTYPLEQASEAHRYSESGMKKANVVITM